MVVTRAWDETRAVEGMIAEPSGSGPMKETKFHVRPPSVVLATNGRPSRPLAFDAVRNRVQSSGPFTR